MRSIGSICVGLLCQPIHTKPPAKDPETVASQGNPMSSFSFIPHDLHCLGISEPGCASRTRPSKTYSLQALLGRSEGLSVEGRRPQQVASKSSSAHNIAQAPFDVVPVATLGRPHRTTETLSWAILDGET
ncbi:unnamed protein product [Protopolystoma xenopodis]|uniref:Uncharacterized protein n=1 Tax=Protopolystoma xenopodis TaxID=117903 RepID=A0A3S5A8P0_9PLAT|nr:unnamed protein product [Protopolystoma xenopodis]